MTKPKKLLLAAGIVVAAILLTMLIVPLFVNADTFRPEIEQALGKMLNRNVSIGHLSVSLFRGSLVADQISISDDPAFSRQPFLTAKSLAVGVELMPLLTSRTLKVEGLTIDRPQLQLLRNARGDWNFDSLGGKATGNPPPASTSGSPAIGSVSVGQFAVNDATVAFGRAGQPTRLAYQDANFTARNISVDQAFPLAFDARTPGGGKLSLAATVGPIADAQANLLPFQGQLKVSKVPAEDVESLLAVLGYALPEGSKLQGGTIAAVLTLHGPFDRLVTSGPVKLTDVHVNGYSFLKELSRALGTAGSATGNDTVIQVASSNLRYAPEGLRADAVEVVIPALGTLTGSGTVSARDQLNFQMVAKITGSSLLSQLVKFPLLSQGNGGLPLKIEGTTEHPRILPNIGAASVGNAIEKLAGPQQGQAGGVGSLLKGLFQKKKKQQP